jgi:hypothetical protein
VFEHLAAHGTVTEPRPPRCSAAHGSSGAFALNFEDLAAKAPFVVRIAEVAVDNLRYVREGTGP